ncbi:MAG: hypothetical protein KKH93_03030 [Candidatus Omnitrophica bacterium]|nr:hypothetical protein [Candidatus Omnitrophota bacterium]MBU2045061.1 hypothetical protein [Candidatus Omnitrophota bacterium]MBU2251098.1 hypothetical protein [Candidatus Omnitrophota bacterium]MBU2266343.1 hypothetical protein [Candidatus Omnitrophota bacterium]
MNPKKAFIDLTGLIMVIMITSVILLLLFTNNLFFAKPAFDNSSQNSSFSEEVDPSQYQSAIKHAERAVDTFKEQLSSQEKLLNY